MPQRCGDPTPAWEPSGTLRKGSTSSGASDEALPSRRRCPAAGPPQGLVMRPVLGRRLLERGRCGSGEPALRGGPPGTSGGSIPTGSARIPGSDRGRPSSSAARSSGDPT
jgi:hypothetical protein